MDKLPKRRNEILTAHLLQEWGGAIGINKVTPPQEKATTQRTVGGKFFDSTDGKCSTVSAQDYDEQIEREVAVTHYAQQEIVAFLEIHTFTHCFCSYTLYCLKKQGERQCVETSTLPLRSFAKLAIILARSQMYAARICPHTIACKIFCLPTSL